MNPDNGNPVVVVVQLTGGNDYLNSVIPFTDSNYYENRLSFSVPQEDVLKLNGQLGLHPTMAPMKEIYERGNLAIINGVGCPAASIPCGMSRDGLPIGLHIVGRPGDEAAVIAASAAFEQARPWANIRALVS